MSRMQKSYVAINFPPLSDKQKEMLEKVSSRPDSEINTKDIPECKGTGGFYYIQSLKIPKTDIHTKIDDDILAILKEKGRGYQTRINNALRWAILNDCPFLTSK